MNDYVSGLLNYFPADELGKVKPWAWEPCFVPGGFITFVAKRTRGGERSEDFFTAVAAHMHPLMTHTAGSASFHKSHKIQGPVMSFTLSSRAVNALLLSATSESHKKPQGHSALPFLSAYLNSKWAFSRIPSTPFCYCSFMVSLNAEHTVCKSLWIGELWLCQVKCLKWKTKEFWGKRRNKSFPSKSWKNVPLLD